MPPAYWLYSVIDADTWQYSTFKTLLSFTQPTMPPQWLFPLMLPATFRERMVVVLLTYWNGAINVWSLSNLTFSVWPLPLKTPRYGLLSVPTVLVILMSFSNTTLIFCCPLAAFTMLAKVSQSATLLMTKFVSALYSLVA